MSNTKSLGYHYKISDLLENMAQELRKLGLDVKEVTSFQAVSQNPITKKVSYEYTYVDSNGEERKVISEI